MNRRRWPTTLWVALLSIGVFWAAACAPGPAHPAPSANPLTLGQDGVAGDDDVLGAALGAGGSVVAFVSEATNLVPGDTNGVADLFVRDVPSGSLTRPVEAVLPRVRITPDGRFVSYSRLDGAVGVLDRVSGARTEWIPGFSGFGFAPFLPVVAPDGATAVYGAYSSFGIVPPACRVRDLATGAESDCPAAGAGYGTVAIDAASADARFVLYFWLDQSGGGTSGRFLWDRTAGTVEPVPADVVGFPGMLALSDDGRYLASLDLAAGGPPFSTRLLDLATGTVRTLPVPPDGTTVAVAVDASGAVLLLSEATNLVPGDTNGAADLFVWHATGGTVSRLSVASDGSQLPRGAEACGRGPGQLLAGGAAACGLTADPAAPADTNAAVDAYRFGA
jgi:hypothetical protein